MGAHHHDLLALGRELPFPIRGALGHSFGGKVSLALLARGVLPLDEVIVVDVDPANSTSRGPRDVEAVVETLCSLPRDYESRSAFTSALAAAGLGATMQAWLSMNLVRTDEGVRFGPDLEAIGALLESHRATDLMDVSLNPPGETRLRFLAAGRSDAISEASLTRLRGAASEGTIEFEVVQGAGHWVQVDAPEAVREFLARQP